MAGVFSAVACCFVVAVRPLTDHVVLIEVADGNCTDMRGAIKIARALLPCVKLIEVRSPDGYGDMLYVKEATGKWTARILRAHAEAGE